MWVHSDLLPPNLLAREGRLTAVIDFGCAGIGDPACDLMAAWTVFDARTRPLFRARVKPDDATWERGRAWALAFGLAAWHYYERSNPGFAAVGRRAVEEAVGQAAWSYRSRWRATTGSASGTATINALCVGCIEAS